jgi:acetyltransferase-like isoleucine patch superfamily enzyme
MITFGMFGAGSTGRSQMHAAMDTLPERFGGLIDADLRLVFVETTPRDKDIQGLEVLSEEDFMALQGDDIYYNVSLAGPYKREEVADRLAATGHRPLRIFNTTTRLRYPNEIGEGALFSFSTMVSHDTKIGQFFHCLSFSMVPHNCTVGDFVTMTSRVNLGGFTEVGNHVFLGAGCLTKPGTPDRPLRIGDSATIGMGAVVLEDVPAGATVAGNPARILSK